MACLSFAALNASASTTSCTDSSLTGANATLANFKALGGTGCQIGDLIFSNFDFEFSDTDTNSVQGHQAVVQPNANSSVFVNIAETTDPGTCDTFGTCGSATNPLYSLVVDYSGDGGVNGSASVISSQTQQLQVQYLVTAAGGAPVGTIVGQIDGTGTAGADQADSGNSANWSKNACIGGTFHATVTQSGDLLNGNCLSGNDVSVVAQNFTATPGSVGLFTNMDQESDSKTQNFGNNVGIHDEIDLFGGNTDTSDPTAAAGSTENDFVEVTNTGTPEPGTFVLLGAALVGLGAIRRKRNA